MSTVSKLEIQGIRSFGVLSGDEQVSGTLFFRLKIAYDFLTFTAHNISNTSYFDCRPKWLWQDNNY